MGTALFALLFAAVAAAAPLKEPGQVLVAVPAGADAQKVMQAARNAFARRKWAVGSDADGALVARNRNFDIDSTLKVFLADGALRYIDGTVDSRGGKAQVPERWLNYVRADLRRSIAALAQRPAAADPAERLRRLKSMLDAGLITQAEYDAKRAEIIKGL